MTTEESQEIILQRIEYLWSLSHTFAGTNPHLSRFYLYSRLLLTSTGQKSIDWLGKTTSHLLHRLRTNSAMIAIRF